jgi:hypothetical protein
LRHLEPQALDDRVGWQQLVKTMLYSGLFRRPNFAAPMYAPVYRSVKVPRDAPPLFICCASDDALVPPRDSIGLYSSWKAAGQAAHGMDGEVQGQ